MPETTPTLSAEHEDSFCANCLSLMVEDHGAGHLCPVCDEHDDCDDFPCSGFDGDACVLNQPLIIHPLKGPPIPAGGHAPDDATPPSSGREAPTAPPADPTLTLTSEQRHDVQRAIASGSWLALYDLIARMVADAEQRGRAEVSAAVEAVCVELTAEDDVTEWGEHGKSNTARRVRAALTDPAAAVARIKAEALREAADKWQAAAWTVLTTPIKAPTQPQRILGAAQAVTDWLRDRADRIGGQP